MKENYGLDPKRLFLCINYRHKYRMKYGYARISTDGQSVDAQVRQLTKPLACTAQWRKSANRMVKGRSPERRATARLRRNRPFRSSRPNRKVQPLSDICTGFLHHLIL